jgi:hypothetical protein
MSTPISYRGLLALAAVALSTLSTACGPRREGRYQGFEYAIMNNQRAGSQSVQLEIRQSGEEFVTGTWKSSTSSGSFQGFLREDRIDSLELQRGTSTTSGMSDPCTGRYTGSLRFDGQRLTGRLTWSTGIGLMNSSSGAGLNIGLNMGCTAVEIDASRLSN